MTLYGPGTETVLRSCYSLPVKTIAVVLFVVWAGGNLALAAGILIAMVWLGQHAPALTILFGPDETYLLHPKSLATIDAMGILLNAVIVAFCALALVLVARFWRRHDVAAFWSASAALVFVQIAGFVSDSYFGHANLTANLWSSGVLAAAIVSGAGAAARR